MVNQTKVKIGIIGLGMVGTPIKRYFEELRGYQRGKNLFCYDIDPKKGFFDDVDQADVIFVCVPTPNGPGGKFNISAVKAALDMIKEEGKVVVIKSTILPSSTVRFQKDYPKLKIVFNPEFLTESQAWMDFIRPDRQIVGYTKKSMDASLAVLSLLPQAPYMTPWGYGCYASNRASATEAEMSKMAANVFGATKVTFGNILADVAFALKNYLQQNGLEADVDYDNVRKIISADHRIGASWLDVGYGDYNGFGGYCFPKDLKSFICFFDDLVVTAKKNKKNADLVSCLESGKKVFEAIWTYNEALLKAQNLTVADVSQHDKDIIFQKKKVIRQKS